MINRLLASDIVMLVGCAIVIAMLIADFLYSQYLYHKPHKDEYYPGKNKKRSAKR